MAPEAVKYPPMCVVPPAPVVRPLMAECVVPPAAVFEFVTEIPIEEPEPPLIVNIPAVVSAAPVTSSLAPGTAVPIPTFDPTSNRLELPRVVALVHLGT